MNTCDQTPSGYKYISPRFTVADWHNLGLSRQDSADWERAVEIFLDRIEGRFLSPINAIRKHATKAIAEFAGFTVIAIDCLLIETLVQFYRGENETSGTHREAFEEFFFNSPHFAREFETKQKAYVFYQHFRCGILHQAQTKKRSLIRYGLDHMVQPVDVQDVAEGLIIDRERFHGALTLEIRDYASALRAPRTKQDFRLRRNFRTKMIFIVGDEV